MSLYHLIYQSQALTTFSQSELSELMLQCHAYNMAHGLTGMLLHAPNGQFLQVLEGEAEAVRHLYYRRIATDPRHEHLIVLGEGPSNTQVFQDWCMSFRAGPDALGLPGYVPPGTAYFRVCNLVRATPELLRLLLDFAVGCDDSPLSESLIGGKR